MSVRLPPVEEVTCATCVKSSPAALSEKNTLYSLADAASQAMCNCHSSVGRGNTISTHTLSIPCSDSQRCRASSTPSNILSAVALPFTESADAVAPVVSTCKSAMSSKAMPVSVPLGTDQNGVRPQNLYLVQDENNPETHLAVQANGAYYDADANAELWKKSPTDGINSAACISSVEAFGPGRYDIKMKPCPRIGALTSMWLFSWFNLDDGSVQQNEIDIEIGLQPYMDTVYFTTWTSNYTQTHESYKPGYVVSDGDLAHLFV